jgi:hypothetical protein
MQGTTVRLELELHFDGDSIRGVLTDEAGMTVDIVGRIGLLAAIDALASPAPERNGHDGLRRSRDELRLT